MPVEATVGRRSYESTNQNHAEEVMFDSGRYDRDDFEVDLDAWPCTGQGFHNCHQLFIDQSAGRVITVNVDDDHGGYAADHGLAFGTTGTIVYNNGTVTYQ